MVVTDVATGGTEFLPLVARQRASDFAPLFPRCLEFGFYKDDLFMNEPVVNWCPQKGLEVTRSLGYRKNDHAWVDLKNGTIASHRIAEYYLVAVRY
jgi:hypothetical protein